MNGYDFDNTIYNGNCFRRFFFYCLLRFPYLILYFPIQLFAWLLNVLHILSKHRFLCILERFIIFVPCQQKQVEKFWDKNIKRIKTWYWHQKRDDDIIISASPQYLVQVACARLGVKCIASQVDIETGKSLAKHCHDKVKVELYRKYFGETPIATYYSDSMTDTPMFKFAQKGYFVKGNKITLLYENGHKLKYPR